MVRNRCFGAVSGAVLLIGTACPARAAPYAYGELDFSNLTLSGLLNTSGVSITGTTVTSSSTADYPGRQGVSQSATGSLISGTDVLQAFSGGSATPGQNVFTRQLTGGSGTRGDSQISGAINADATAHIVGEGRLTATPATASSTGGTSTGIGVNIAVAATTVISLGFTASSHLIASTVGVGEGASAQVNASFTITQGATTITNFAPDALNFSVSSTNGTGDSIFDSGPIAYSTGPFTLTPGNYQIQLLAGVQERLDTSAVPVTPASVREPASMALLGAGLLSLGIVRNRRRAKLFP